MGYCSSPGLADTSSFILCTWICLVIFVQFGLIFLWLRISLIHVTKRMQHMEYDIDHSHAKQCLYGGMVPLTTGIDFQTLHALANEYARITLGKFRVVTDIRRYRHQSTGFRCEEKFGSALRQR